MPDLLGVVDPFDPTQAIDSDARHVVLFVPTVALVCPMCGDIVGDDPAATPNPILTFMLHRPAAYDSMACLDCWDG